MIKIESTIIWRFFMKKLVLYVVLVSLFVVLVGCGSADAPSAVDTPQKDEDITTPEPVKGEIYETERFSLTVPDNWNVMDVQGGVQLYRMSGEIFEVHFQGFNQGEGHAREQIEWLAEQYDGTEPKEVELIGKRFWMTSFTASGVPQVAYHLIEEGEMLSIKYGGPGYETDPVFTAILDSIVFK